MARACQYLQGPNYPLSSRQQKPDVYPYCRYKMSPPMSGKGKESGAARILGSGTSGAFLCSPRRGSCSNNCTLGIYSGVAELLIFHPVDTVAKRLMSNKVKVCSALSSFSSSRAYRVQPEPMCIFVSYRSPSLLCHLSSSVTTRRRPSDASYSRYSQVSGTPPVTRSLSGYTSLVDSRGSTIS